MIVNAPTGISWSIIPFPQADSASQLAEQTNMCWRASGMINAYCNQVLRATVDTERLNGPDFRLTIQNGTQNARLMLSRWPITQVLQVAVSPNAFPRQWQVVPSNMYEVERPPIGVYGSSAPSAAGDGGQSILVGAGYVNRSLGRWGFTTSSTYTNGWPHSSLTQSYLAGVQSIAVDDVTAFAGANCFIYDGNKTETVQITSATATTPFGLPFGGTTDAGPGLLTLQSATLFSHSSGVVISALPQDILWATIVATTIQALESGVTAVTIQTVNGSETVGGSGILSLQNQYQSLLKTYRRVI